MVSIYSPNGTNDYGDFEEIGSVYGLKVIKSCSYETVPINMFRHFHCRM